MRQNAYVNMPVSFTYWDLVKNMSTEAKRSLIVLLQQSLDSEAEQNEERLPFSEAKLYLSKHKLANHSVPADINGMRDEVNPKYL